MAVHHHELVFSDIVIGADGRVGVEHRLCVLPKVQKRTVDHDDVRTQLHPGLERQRGKCVVIAVGDEHSVFRQTDQHIVGVILQGEGDGPLAEDRLEDLVGFAQLTAPPPTRPPALRCSRMPFPS